MAFASVVSLLVVTAPPAAAIDVIPAPPGGGYGTVGGGTGRSGTEGVISDCTNGRMHGLHSRSRRMMFENWPGCRFFTHNGIRYNWTIGTYQHYCTHTFEVWRFYGTRANPVQARTVSRVNLEPCNTRYRVLINEGHPEDSSQTPLFGLVEPYRRGTVFGSPLVGVQASISAIGTNDVPQQFVITSNWPFRRTGLSCHRLMSRDPNPPSSGDQYDRMASIWRSLAARWGRWWADATMDRVGGTYENPVFGNNGLDCSSPTADFAVPAQPGVPYSQQQDVRVSGVCAIPVWREHAITTNPVTREVWYAAIRPGVVNWAGTPEVYSQYYGIGSTSNARTPENEAILNAMRLSIYDEVVTRPWSARTPGLYPEDQARPPWASSTDGDLGRAGLVAALFSHCRFSTGNTFSTAPTTTITTGSQPLPGDAVRLYAEVPEAGQVGGDHLVTTIRTRLATGPAGQEVLCGSSWCPVAATGPNLVEVNLDLSRFLSPPPDADFRVIRPIRPNARTGSADTPWTGLQLSFFKPTGRPSSPGSPDACAGIADSQCFKLALSGTAVLEGVVGSDQQVTTCAPFGGGCVTHPSTIQQRVRRTVPVQVVWVRSLDSLEPVQFPEFPVVNATATPIERRGS